VRGKTHTSGFNRTSGIFEDEEFLRLVRLGLGKSSLMIRKDRKGIAI